MNDLQQNTAQPPAQNSPPPAASAPATPPGDAAPPHNTATPPPGAAMPPPVATGVPASLAPPTKERPSFDRTDGLFAIAGMALGYLFTQWVILTFFRGWGVAAFALLYAPAVLLYAHKRGCTPPKHSWYWLAIFELSSISCALLPQDQLTGWRMLLIFASCLYWTASAFDGLLAGKTSNFLPLDIITQWFSVPFINFAAGIHSIAVLRTPQKPAKTGKRRTVLAILLGLLICVPLLAILLPMLITADSGIFRQMMGNFGDWLANILENIDLSSKWINPLALGLSLFFSLCLCGLVIGYARKHETKRFNLEKTQKNAAAIRILPNTTVITVLGVVSALYAVYIGCQLPYFFSAFAGQRPAGYLVYSEYARQGFFELCAIASINAALILVTGCLARKSHRESKPLRWLNLALCGTTLILLATAASKMIMYISVYGYTGKRVLTCAFMAFLAGIFVAVMLLQFRQFSIIRVAAVYGSALLCVLCLCNLDGLIARANVNRYLAGELPHFDVSSGITSNPACYQAGLELYYNGSQMSADEKSSLAWDLRRAQERAGYTKGYSYDNLLHAQVRSMPPLELMDENTDS